MKSKRILNISIWIVFGLLILLVTPATADVFKIDPVHSAITFRIKHLGISYVHGRFNQAFGAITFDENLPASNAVEIAVKVGIQPQKKDITIVPWQSSIWGILNKPSKS